MVERTPNRRYQYPECDPPLTKDRSDIRFMQSLALEINGDVGLIAQRLFDTIIEVDAARVSWSGIGIGGEFTVPYNFGSYDNRGDMIDLTNNGIVAREPGWYMIYSYVQGTNVGNNNLSIRHLKNTQAQNRFEGPARSVVGTDTNMTTMDVWPLQPGDLIQTRVKLSNVGPFNYNTNLQVLQILRTDT